jgi:flagellum-specific peptidoglycan hydrolase FlgJ
MKLYLIALICILLPFSVLTMSAGKKEYTSKRTAVMAAEHKPTVSHVKNKFLHAGADEHYPDLGYDADGWSKRGYMSSDEMAGKHLKGDMQKLQRFEQRKAKVKRDFVDSMSRKAVRICRKFDVPPSILVAQAILETNYGTSRLCNVANNYFGHMSRDESTPRGIAGRLKAFDRNVAGKLKSYFFRVYESNWWSMWYHLHLLEDKYAQRKVSASSKREQYMAALCGCKDKRMLASDSKAEAERKGGFLYAGACAWTANDGVTSRYVNELRFIIKLHNLEKIDKWL